MNLMRKVALKKSWFGGKFYTGSLATFPELLVDLECYIGSTSESLCVYVMLITESVHYTAECSVMRHSSLCAG